MKYKSSIILQTSKVLYPMYMVLFCVFFLFASCKNSSNSDKSSRQVESTSSKNTQALLLTMPFEFDVNDKDKVIGDYVSQKKITVPPNLATQSKWIMFEGPILENDLVAYRYYADSRHRFDIYGKLVSDLVMDTVSWEYHEIMDWGSDILKVGNSLGLGSPAIYFKDSLYYLSSCEKKEIEVIENTPTRSMIRTTFTGLSISGSTFNLVQDWSLNANEAWSEIQLKVVGGILPEGMKFATGFVKHLPEVIQGVSGEVFYAMNWGTQSFHKEGMGMAVLANQKYSPKRIVDKMSHAYIFDNANKEITYRFLSAWERDGNKVTDVKGLKLLVERAGMFL